MRNAFAQEDYFEIGHELRVRIGSKQIKIACKQCTVDVQNSFAAIESFVTSRLNKSCRSSKDCQGIRCAKVDFKIGFEEESAAFCTQNGRCGC